MLKDIRERGRHSFFSRNRTGRQPRQGFTLIELLVVMAIMAILAAILFPVFQKARGRANLVACQSNLRQIGQAFVMYANDWDGYFPTGLDWMLLNYGGKNGKPGQYDDRYSNKLYPPLNRYVGWTKPAPDWDTDNDEVGTLLVFRCPSNEDWRGTIVDWRHSPWDAIGTSYYFNQEALDLRFVKDGPQRRGLGLTRRRVSHVVDPSKTVMVSEVLDTLKYANNGYQWPEYPQGWRWRSHKADWGNAVFVDGHVRFIKMTRGAGWQSGDGWTYKYDESKELP